MPSSLKKPLASAIMTGAYSPLRSQPSWVTAVICCAWAPTAASDAMASVDKRIVMPMVPSNPLERRQSSTHEGANVMPRVLDRRDEGTPLPACSACGLFSPAEHGAGRRSRLLHHTLRHGGALSRPADQWREQAGSRHDRGARAVQAWSGSRWHRHARTEIAQRQYEPAAPLG